METNFIFLRVDNQMTDLDPVKREFILFPVVPFDPSFQCPEAGLELSGAERFGECH
jgi:hypothetical protein